MAQKSTLSKLLGDGSVGRQLLVWGILNNFLMSAMQPIMAQLMAQVWPKLPSQRLSPADAAEMVLKGIMTQGEGEAEALGTGTSPERFRLMVRNVGEPMSIQEALFAVRRGIIPWEKGAGNGPSFMEAVRQSRLRDEWGPVFQELQWQPLTPSDAVDAVVESQIDYAQGEQEAGYNGIKPEHFRILFNTRGRPPGVMELLELNRRGVIPMEGTGPDVVSVQQGVYEGATKNKWFGPLSHLLDYVPPPRTVTTLLRQGVITQDQALHYFEQSGLTPDLAAAYIRSASTEKLAKHRDLTESVVLDLYYAHIITQQKCTEMLAGIGYDAAEAHFLIALKDMQRSLAALNKAVERIGSMYIARKLTRTKCVEALKALDIPPAQQTELLTLWDLDRSATVRVLSEAQIVAAVEYEIVTPEQGRRMLEQLNYSPYDAWLLVSVRLKAKTGDPPAEGANVTEAAQ